MSPELGARATFTDGSVCYSTLIFFAVFLLRDQRVFTYRYYRSDHFTDTSGLSGSAPEFVKDFFFVPTR